MPWRFETTPYGTRGRSARISTSSTSPGCAPATATGPVITCGPSFAKSCWMSDAAIAIASRSTLRRGTPWAPKNATGSRPWSSRMPSCETVSKVTTPPEGTVATGFVVALGSRPQLTVSGVERM